MAIDSAYATAEQYRAAIDRTDTSDDDEILLDLKAISRYIEGKLQRFFNKDAEDVSRIYTCPKTSDTLRIDDLSELTSIEIDTNIDGTYNVTLDSDDYELLPVNANLGPEPRPYTQIWLTDWGDYSAFYKGQRIKVTGKFGWPSVPEAVKRATIHLTAILRLETPRATRRIPELGEAIEASPDAQHIIRQLTDNYRRIRYV